MHKIGVIGGGNMGEAIINSVRQKCFVSVSEKNPARAEYLHAQYRLGAVSIEELVTDSDVVILAVKPQDMEETLKAVNPFIVKEKLLISIAAGITTSYIEKNISKRIRTIRAMPNMPAMISEGITAICPGKYSKHEDVDEACKIFDHFGKTIVVKEEMMDSITAVSGSGPAYVFYFLESLIKAAQSLGLKEDLSRELVLSTVLGSVHLLEKQKGEPSALREKVTSKGGTTQAAVDVLKKNDFEEIFIQALEAAKKRAAELSRR